MAYFISALPAYSLFLPTTDCKEGTTDFDGHGPSACLVCLKQSKVKGAEIKESFMVKVCILLL